MIYMNGKNSLDSYAVRNFRDIASIKGSDKINVLVQLGRPEVASNAGRPTNSWGGVRRYRMTQGISLASAPLVDLGSHGPATDMGDPATLRDFIQWSVNNFKATHYALIISSHGQGWRFQQQLLDAVAHSNSNGGQALSAISTNGVASPPSIGGYRSVSRDDDTKNTLFNRQIETVLEGFVSQGIKLDLIGFDACLMGMLETAYAMRHVAIYMIASEELEPDNGWNYAGWFSAFAQQIDAGTPAPGGTADEALLIGDDIISTYHKQEGETDSRTLSMVQLSNVQQAADDLSGFARALSAALSTERSGIARARRSDYWFGMDVTQSNTSVDLPRFLTKYTGETSDPQLRALALKALASVKSTVKKNFASQTTVAENLGGEGMAIFFPPTLTDFLREPDHSGYLRGNKESPVEFVEDNDWSLFLKAYVGFSAQQ